MRVTPALDTLGSFVICNPADPDLIQNDPAVAFDGENYLVAWSDEKHGNYNTTFTRVTPGGAVLDTGIRVAPSPATYEYRPNVASDGERWLVVWYRSSTGIYGRFVNRGGEPEGDLIRFDSGQSGGPNLAFDGTNYLVVWFRGSYPDLELFGRITTPQGTFVGDTIALATGSGCHRWADVEFDGTNYLVVWQTGDNVAGQDINARFVAPDGSLGATFRISDNTGNRRWWPAAAPSDSNFLVVWGQGSSSDVWGNVDALVTGIAQPAPPAATRPPAGPTVLDGTTGPTTGGRTFVYDALGRRRSGPLAPGIYYLAEPDSHNPRRLLVVR